MESSNDKLDPDYATNNAALRNVERREEINVPVETIHRIIKEEFHKELSFREKQLEEIEEQIAKAQKLLHLVRYALITSYYNKKSLEHTTTSEEQMCTVFDGQNRIHPAIKKLIGKNACLDVFSVQGKRKAAIRVSTFGEPSTSQGSSAKKPKQEPKGNLKPQSFDSNQNCLQNRQKTCHRVVIGNISKYMPSFEDDSMTHKWMVYVRGDKIKPDISDIIEKVVFYLHPSYKPYDVVEVSESPFHLSRRGWGEFPLRVQIFFKNSLNKPVDIVHNLKLDKACTGRQVLGNETLVDVYLHDSPKESNVTVKCEPDEIKEEPLIESNIIVKRELPEVNIKDEPTSSEVLDFDQHINEMPELESSYIPLDMDSANEHNYCQGNGEDGDSINMEHSYSLLDGENTTVQHGKGESNLSEILEQGNNRLIFGLGDNYLDENKKKGSVTTKKPLTSFPMVSFHQPIKILPAALGKLVNFNNGQVVQLRLLLPQECQPKRLTQPARIEIRNDVRCTPFINYQKHRIALPRNRFKNLGEALMFLMRRLPLWNTKAKELDFKCTYPYVASTKEDFEGWNIGKKVNSEWCRARTLKKILVEESFPSQEEWSTKTYFMYARSHGYCSFVKPGPIFSKYSKDITLINECFSNSLTLPRSMSRTMLDLDVDGDVDIESNGEVNDDNVRTSKIDIDISDASLQSHCTFIKEAALDVGVVLKPEEIVEGVVMNAAERVILEAVKCLAENLIRRAHHHTVCETTNTLGCLEVTKEKIQIALKERPEMETIFRFQKMKKERQFFT